MDSWNNHSLSSEQNQTPNQLFVRGALQENHRISLPFNGIVVPHPNDIVTVLLMSDLYHVRCWITLVPSITAGRNVFALVIEIVGQHLSENCPNCILP